MTGLLSVEVMQAEIENAEMRRSVTAVEENARLRAQMVAAGLPPVVCTVTLSMIASAVATEHAITVADLRGRGNARRVAWARQDAYWRSRAVIGRHGTPRWSLTQIAEFYGRDHTTVLYGVRAVEERQRLQSRDAA